MRNGGFMMDSKKEIYDLIPAKYYPNTVFIQETISSEELKIIFKNANFSFPIIVKPDMGLRGSAVKKITNFEQLITYNTQANFDYLLQDVIPFSNEVGIFYVRFPNEKKGRITGIVGKEFLEVIGDGKSTIEQLVKMNPRFELQLASLQKEYGDKMKTILSQNEKLNLVPLGNHCRGSKFLDFSNLISDKLINVIDEICIQIPEFYFGRMDIMYNSWEELERGENFQLIELNGAASEPTHIYDPKHSIFFAWKELARHITYMYKISVINNKRGFAFLSHKEGMLQYRLHNQMVKKYEQF